jgi:hypothetical protein
MLSGIDRIDWHPLNRSTRHVLPRRPALVMSVTRAVPVPVHIRTLIGIGQFPFVVTRFIRLKKRRTRSVVPSRPVVM